MKKFLSVLLVMVMTVTLLPLQAAFAADVTIGFDFEAYQGSAPTQDPGSFTWVGYNQWETAWQASRFTTTDTWLEPAARGTGTALRLFTKDNTTAAPAAANDRTVYMNRPRSAGPAGGGELWVSFDWMIEDYNAIHKIAMYLYVKNGTTYKNTYHDFFVIDMTGALSALGTKVGMTIKPGEWHTYAVCMSKTNKQLLFYVDDALVHTVEKDHNGNQSTFLFLQEVQPNGVGKLKGSAMQLDNLKIFVPEQPADKRLCGVKNESFSVAQNGGSITFTGTPYNKTAADRPYLLVLNVYDETGHFVARNTLSGMQNVNAAEAPVSVTVDRWGEGWTAKAFVQNSWTDRTPFANKIFNYSGEDAKPTVFVYKNFDATTGGLHDFSIQVSDGSSLVTSGTESYYQLSNTDTTYVSDVLFSGATRELMFEIKVKQVGQGASLSFMNVSGTNGFDQFLTVHADGGFVEAGTQTVGNLVSGEWNHIIVATDFNTNTLSVRLNNEQVASNISRRDNTDVPVKIRFARWNSNASGSILVDDLRVYSGTKPAELSADENEILSILGNDALAKAALTGKHAVHAYSSQIAVNGERKKTDTPAFMQNDVVYAAQNDLSEMLGASVAASAGSSTVSVGSKAITLSDAAVAKNGAIYVPAKELAEKLSMTTQQGERGVLLFAEKYFNLDENTLYEVNDYMQYGRLAPAEVKTLLQAKTSHPRTAMTASDFERVRTAHQNDPNYKTRVDGFIAGRCAPDRAIAPTGTNWYTVNDFMTGYLITGEDYMFQKIRQAVEAMLSMESWRAGNDSLEPAELLMTMAICYDWLYDRWSTEYPDLCARMEQRMVTELDFWETVLNGTDAKLTDSATIGNNITGVCMSSALVGAVAVWDKAPDKASYVIAESMRALEKVMNNFYPAGSWPEGLDYSSYQISRLSHGLSTIQNTLGHDYGFLTAPGFRRFVDFYMAMHGNSGGSNFGDSVEFPTQVYYDGLVFPWAAHVFNSPEIYTLGKRYMEISGRPDYLEHILYYHSEWENLSSSEVQLPLDSYFTTTEDVVLRDSYDKNGVYLAAQFGKTTASHAHYDVGTFILDMLGERWAVDLGKDDYTLPGYFVTGSRDNYYRCRPEGHNLFVINPDEAIGQTYTGFAPVTSFESSEAEAFAIGDLSSVYADDALSAKRGFMLTDNRSSVVIRDEIRTETASTIYWFMQTAATITVVDGDTAILSQNGKQVQLDFVSNASNVELYYTDAVPLASSPNPAGQNQNAGVRRLTIRVPSASSLDLTVRITPVGSAAANTAVPDLPLARWTTQGN